MKEINYIDFQERTSRILDKLAVELEKFFTKEPYSEEQFKDYLEKYNCENAKELIYLFLCEAKPADLNISLNMRQKIKNISEEVNKDESADEESLSKTLQVRIDKDEMVKKIELMSEQQNKLYTKIQELVQINNTLQLKLKSNSKSDLGL